MKVIIFFVAAMAAIVSVGCKGTPVPMEYAAVCDKANDKKYVEVVGYFNNNGSAMCSKRGQEAMKCPVYFVSEPGAPKPMRAELYLGETKNGVVNPEKNGLKITDDKGAFVENAEKVKITGSIFNFSGSATGETDYLPCSVTVDKVEKVN